MTDTPTGQDNVKDPANEITAVGQIIAGALLILFILIPGYILIAWWPDRLPAAKEGIRPLYINERFHVRLAGISDTRGISVNLDQNKRNTYAQKVFFMKKISLIAWALFFFGFARAQKMYQEYTPSTDSLHYGPGQKQVFPPGSKGYALLLPDNGKEPMGTVLILDVDKVDLSDTAKNIFLVGAMTGGHRALKYIEYCKKGKSSFHPAIKGVVLSESAIDWVRQWYECQKQTRDHVTRHWFSAQGKGIYDSNYPDMSGFINEQLLVGNKNASLIVFSSSLTDPLKNDMRRQSSTWNLIDKNELMEWMAKMAGMGL